MALVFDINITYLHLKIKPKETSNLRGRIEKVVSLCYYKFMLHTLCPICKNPLENKLNSAICKNGHTFDFAKEGYLYLLTPNERHSKDPGDNKDMVLARKRFLEGEHYAPLAAAVADIIAEADKPVTLIDAGVGTGYYLNKIIASRACATNKMKTDVYLGADISKYAVKYASKLNSAAECAVASVYNLPYADNCADFITCIFSPYAMAEYKRLLKDDGYLIIASPAKNHLIELRHALYDSVREVATPPPSDGFDIVKQEELTFRFTLSDKDEIASLLMMTPYAYRAPKEKISALELTDTATFTADFKITVMRKSR